MEIDGEILDEIRSAFGAHLEEKRIEIKLVVVGGASLAANRLVSRTTKDVDVIAKVSSEGDTIELSPATPFPTGFNEAVRTVARDFGLAPDWLNTVIESQWIAGLPPNITENIVWKEYSTLTIGFISREALIPLKFFAALDQGRRSKHWLDLLALRPSHEEIKAAADWVRGQDAGREFQQFVKEAIEHLRRDLAGHPPSSSGDGA